jgi:serine/threonine protein kinase
MLQIALVMKYMSNGSLQDICYKESNSYHSNLSNEMKLKFSYQAAKGVLNLHSKNIIHRDLACRNLLVDDKLDIYVADFGFARLKHVTTSKEFTATKLGPVRWEAPESLERKEYSEKTDSFSFGVCIYEIITGKQPWDFCTTPTMVAVNVLRGNRLHIPINCDPILADLAWNCWHENPALRPTFPKMVSVLSDRYKQVLEDTRAIEKELLCVEFMIVGVDVLKYPFIKVDEKFRLKKPQNRYLRLKSNLKSLVWRSSTANNVFSSASRNKVVERGIEIKDILEVKVGFATENFRLQTGHQASSLSVSCSFSIVTANRSLDITCESSSHRDLWVWGVRYLLNRHRESQSAGNRLISELKLFYFSSQQTALHSLQRLTLVSLPANPSSFQSHEYLNLLRSLVYRLQRGDIIVKFKSNRKVHAKRIFLSPDLTEIVWNMKDEEENANKRPKSKSILLSEIESVSYDPPNFFFGNSRVAAVAANLSESLLRRHHTASSSSLYAQGASASGPLTSDRISKKDRASSETFDTSSIPEKKTRPRKNSQDSVGTPTPGGQATSATWVQALIPSLKREDPSAQQPQSQSHFQGSVASETDTDARPDDLDQEHGLHAEDIDAQYCISYLRHDGRILLAIQCPNRDVFELWTDGLTAIITGLKHTKNQTTAVTYNSGAEFTLPLPSDSESSRHRLLTQVQPSSPDLT